MTAIELNARKVEMIRMILNDVNSEVVVGELENIIRKLVASESPCRYSPEEIRTSAVEAITQRKEGRYTSHEKMMRFIEIAPK